MTQYRYDESLQALIGPDGSDVKLRPQSLEVFRFLLEHSEEVVSKEAILDHVWGSLSVTDDSVTQCIADIRRALGSEHRKLLQTVPKRGYRLSTGIAANGKACILHLSPSTDHPHSTVGKEVAEQRKNGSKFWPSWIFLSLLACATVITGYGVWIAIELGGNRDKAKTKNVLFTNGPSLAVLPFKNASSSDDNEYFSDGITEDISTALARFSNFQLMSWNAVSQYPAENQNLSEIADTFDIRYLVTGTIQQSHDRLRITVRLTDAVDGKLLWSNRFDKPLLDIFLLQDQISTQVAATLSVELSNFETERIASKPTDSFEAYDHTLRGRKELRERTLASNLVARSSLENAVSIDPEYASAHIDLALTYIEESILGWTEWPDRALEKAVELLVKSISLQNDNARAHGVLARTYMHMNRIELAESAIAQALLLNPNDPSIRANRGYLYLWTGHPNKALTELEFAQRFDPYNPVVLNNLGVSYYLVGRYNKAIVVLERGLSVQTETSGYAQMFLSAAYAEIDDLDAATDSARKIKRYYPFFSIANIGKFPMLGNDQHRDQVISSLKMAGMK